MGVEVPSFLVDDKAVPRLRDVPKTPGPGGYGPYPILPRYRRYELSPSDAAESPHDETADSSALSGRSDDLEMFYTASSPSANSIASVDTSHGSPKLATPSAPPPVPQAPPIPQPTYYHGVQTPKVSRHTPSSQPAPEDQSPKRSQGASAPLPFRRQQTVKKNKPDLAIDIPWNTHNPKEWTRERVMWWLEVNGFGSQWRDTFAEHDIHGASFLDLTSFRNVKRLGIPESPARFIRLLRTIVPLASSPAAVSPARVTPPHIVIESRGEQSSAPSQINEVPSQQPMTTPKAISAAVKPTKASSPATQKLAGARRTSLEKFLFLDTRLRPRRKAQPGPSVLVTLDNRTFRLVGISDSQNAEDVRAKVYTALYGEAPRSVDCAKFRLTDYYCVPGEPLNDQDLWAVLCAASGDIVKFSLEVTPPPVNMTMPEDPAVQMGLSRTPAMVVGSPDWNMSSEDALSPPGPGPHRVYPPTPSYLMATAGQQRDYFTLPAQAPQPRLRTSQANLASAHSPPVPSSSQRQITPNQLRRTSTSSSNGQGAPLEQLVALRVAPKPPLARSLSSKYRPELSPVDSPSPFDGASSSKEADSEDDEAWPDAPELEDSSNDSADGEESSAENQNGGDDGGMWAKAPAVKPTPILSVGRPIIEPVAEEDSEKERNSSQSSGEGSRPVKPGLSLQVPRQRQANHKTSLSESSLDSPRSPGTALLEQASIDWASRPPAEILYENLERFFPNTDLDKPVVLPSQTKGGEQASQISPVSARDHEQLRTPAPSSVGSSDTSRASSVSSPVSVHSTAEYEAIGDDPPSLPPAEEADDAKSTRTQSTHGSSMSRAKSIRIVAREASRRLRTDKKQPSDLLRRKSTKMWGQRVVEMRNASTNAVTLRDHKQYVWIKGEMIGQGSFGKVYLGLNATTGDMMAVKQVKAPRSRKLNGDAKDAIADSMKALYAEVENMKDLDHLNIVQYLGFERLDRVSNLFLEYVPGGSVKSLLINFGRFPEDTIRFLTRQVLDGMSYLHSRGILHRDLKADNLLLDIDGTIKISDFGISKRSRDIYANNAEMSMQGTIFWMAPEVIHNVIKNQKQGYSAKVDIWSLGCVILEMFVGRRPWSTEEAIGAMYKLGSSKQAPPIPEDSKSFVSATGKDFLDCCFVIDPKKRPTARELLQHKFSTPDNRYKFAATKLGIELRRSVKRTSTFLKRQNSITE